MKLNLSEQKQALNDVKRYTRRTDTHRKKLNHKMLDDRKRARIHYLIIRSPVVHINENALRYHRAQTSN